MCFHIKQPVTDNEFSAYFKLRWQLLRAPWNQPKGSEVDDIEEQCFHIMAVDKQNNVTGVARLQFNSTREVQIRYMAVAKEHERKGIGRLLINAIEDHANTSLCKEIVLDAREPAVGFYKKFGYKKIEKSYLLFGEIQHIRMSKTL